jgi:hypothetical protein
MSYRDPGVPYIPPPPPAPQRSPLLYFGIGCGVLLLLMAGCTSYFVYQIKNVAVEAMKKPLDIDAALAAMGDAPIYPGAQLDQNMTKVQRGVTATLLQRVTPADRMEMVAYSTVDPPEKVMAWYTQVMPKKGFVESADADYSKFGRSTLHKQYRKGHDLVVVQPQQRTRSTNDTTIVLIRFYNIREKGGS